MSVLLINIELSEIDSVVKEELGLPVINLFPSKTRTDYSGPVGINWKSIVYFILQAQTLKVCIPGNS